MLDRLTGELLENGNKRAQLSRHTIGSYLRSVNVFLTWAKAEGEAVEGKAKLPKPSKRLLEVLSRDEIQALEDVAVTERDKLIVRILGDTGISVGELVNLTTHDLINRDRNLYLRVGGKTGERLVPIPRLSRRLQKYVDRGRPRDVASDRIFISLKRRPGGDYGTLTPSGVEQLLQDPPPASRHHQTGLSTPAAALVRDVGTRQRDEPNHAGSHPWPHVARDDPECVRSPNAATRTRPCCKRFRQNLSSSQVRTPFWFLPVDSVLPYPADPTKIAF
jgi:hypothetical protein